MPAPFDATGRIQFIYTVSSLQHKMAAFVRNIQNVGSTFNINSRATDANDLDWKDAADGLWNSFSYGLGSAATVGAAELHQKVGALWVPIATHTLPAGNGSGGTQQFGEFTITLRDVDFHQVKVVILEGNFTAPFTSRDVSAFGGAITTMVEQWTSARSVGHAPYDWQVGRSNHYLAASGTFIKGTATLNRKVRRRRGVA